MAEERVLSRRAAILAASVAGYERLMGEDEDRTRAILKGYHIELIAPLVSKYRGERFKTAGEGFLAEFAGADDAVQCAAEIQTGIRLENMGRFGKERIEYRMGVNLGDVILRDDAFYGDAVNIAMRLENLAEPATVCVSGAVAGRIQGVLKVDLNDLGRQEFENIAEPVHAFSVNLSEAARRLDETEIPTSFAPVDKPSIAVLPFADMSGDPDREYFADGVAEDIITALSRFHWLFVIARNSSFIHRGEAVDVGQVARKLGVDNVLEGSVRKAGSRVRITAQLVEAITGSVVWAGSYDRDQHDIFAVQDEITESIAGFVAPSFVSAEARRLERKAPESFDAWNHAIRGNWHLWRGDRDNVSKARGDFHAAINLDPDNAMALCGLALACSLQAKHDWAGQADKTRDLAYRTARQAVADNALDAWAHYALGQVCFDGQRLDEAEREIRRALELNPNLAVAQRVLSETCAWLGQYDAAIENFEKAARRDPGYHAHPLALLPRVYAPFVVGRYEEQVEWARKLTEAAPHNPAGWRFLAAGYGLLGRQDQAGAAVQGMLRIYPGFTIESIRTASTGMPEADLERLLDGLRKAGLPE